MPAGSESRDARRTTRRRAVVIPLLLAVLAGGVVLVDMRLGLAHSALALLALTAAGFAAVALAVAWVARREADESRNGPTAPGGRAPRRWPRRWRRRA